MSITIENIVALDYEYTDKILAAQSEVDAASAMKRATGYLKMWRDYHLREHMRIDNIEVSKLFLQYENTIHKFFLKRCRELEQNERFDAINKLSSNSRECLRRRMNKSQLRALFRLWNRNSKAFPTFLAMRRAAQCHYNEYFGINLAGMFIGIERDGYTHS